MPHNAKHRTRIVLHLKEIVAASDSACTNEHNTLEQENESRTKNLQWRLNNLIKMKVASKTKKKDKMNDVSRILIEQFNKILKKIEENKDNN